MSVHTVDKACAPAAMFRASIQEENSLVGEGAAANSNIGTPLWHSSAVCVSADTCSWQGAFVSRDDHTCCSYQVQVAQGQVAGALGCFHELHNFYTREHIIVMLDTGLYLTFRLA